MSGYSYGGRSIWKRPDVIEALRDALGRKLSAGEAAKELSEKFGVPISRNAVMGKAFREGIAIISERKNGGWFKPSDKPKTPPPEKVYVVCRKPVAAAAPAKPIEPPSGRGLHIMSLKHRDCRWPTGRDVEGNHIFCGADRVKPLDGSNAYCAFHSSLAYVPTGKINMRPVKQANCARAGVNPLWSE